MIIAAALLVVLTLLTLALTGTPRTKAFRIGIKTGDWFTYEGEGSLLES